MSRPRKRDKHLPPCVYEKHGAFWYVKAKKWERMGATLTEALAWYADKVDGPKGGMDAFIDATLPLILKDAADSTRTQYEAAAKVLKRKLAEFAPHQVKQKHMSSLKKSMADTPNMANRVLSVARQLFNQAVEAEEIDSNPCIGVERFAERKRKRLLSDAEWQAIHDQADPRLRVIMELQYYTGQRISDVLSIRRSQIGPEGISFEQKKTGARLLVKWSPELRATVATANALNKTPALTLLRGKYGSAPEYRSVFEQWQRACKAAGVQDARLNDGRAKSATAAKKQGKNARALLGHTSDAMTERYIRERETAVVDGPSFRQSSK